MMPRVVAWAVLGIILISLGYGYVKAFAGEAADAPQLEEEPESEPESEDGTD